VPSLPYGYRLLSGQKLRNSAAHIILDNKPRIEVGGKPILEFDEKENGVLAIFDSGSERILLTREEATNCHNRYGHLPPPAFKHIREAPQSLVNMIIPCKACAQAKSTKVQSPINTYKRSQRVLELLYSDLWVQCVHLLPKKDIISWEL
jgi:hypothetical protein